MANTIHFLMSLLVISGLLITFNIWSNPPRDRKISIQVNLLVEDKYILESSFSKIEASIGSQSTRTEPNSNSSKKDSTISRE